jgi:AmiR/NasT family two-component response regulator
MPSLLAIIEMGGYPNFIPLYQSMGFSVEVVNSMRKARSSLKKHAPDVIVAEYNFQSQFRDRTSNLETLMAVLQKHGGSKVIAFYEQETRHKLDQLTERFPLHATLTYPVQESELRSALASLASEP